MGGARRPRSRPTRRRLLAELAEADAAGDREELLVVGGQSAGLIEHVEPAAAIVRALVAEARAALAEAARSSSRHRRGSHVVSTDRGPAAQPTTRWA